MFMVVNAENGRASKYLMILLTRTLEANIQLKYSGSEVILDQR